MSRARRNPMLLCGYPGCCCCGSPHAPSSVCCSTNHREGTGSASGLLPLQKIVLPKITRRKPSVSACRAWPIQLCTAGLKSSQSSRPAAWPSAKPEACGQSDGHCRCAVGDDRERRGNPADQYLGHVAVVEVLWHRPVGHRLKHLERPWPLHLAHPTRSDRRHGRPSVCRRLRPRGRDTS